MERVVAVYQLCPNAVAVEQPLQTKSFSPKVMMTFNINTTIDVANGARGEVIKVVDDLNNIRRDACVLESRYPPV